MKNTSSGRNANADGPINWLIWMRKYVFLLVGASLLFSCGNQKKSEMERLKTENDSLQNAKVQLENEVNDYFATMNDIQENIDKIKTAQNAISVEPISENTPQNIKDKMTKDMDYINELIKTDQQEIEKLRTRMKRSTFQLDNMERNLAALQKQLNEESAKVARLQAQILQKDSVINQLGTTVDALGKNVKELSQANDEKAGIIQQQDEALNTAWYAIGTSKELKDNKIVSSNGMFSAKKVMQGDFNKNYFVKVDSRVIKSIPLYSVSKVKILTNHPKSSYNIEKNKDNYMLNITNPADFWSVSKYLVIEAD